MHSLLEVKALLAPHLAAVNGAQEGKHVSSGCLLHIMDIMVQQVTGIWSRFYNMYTRIQKYLLNVTSDNVIIA